MQTISMDMLQAMPTTGELHQINEILSNPQTLAAIMNSMLAPQGKQPKRKRDEEFGGVVNKQKAKYRRRTTVEEAANGAKLPYACPHCPRSYQQQSALITHLRVHTLEKPFVCAYCQRGFSQKANMHRHLDSCKVKKSTSQIMARMPTVPDLPFAMPPPQSYSPLTAPLTPPSPSLEYGYLPMPPEMYSLSG